MIKVLFNLFYNAIYTHDFVIYKRDYPINNVIDGFLIISLSFNFPNEIFICKDSVWTVYTNTNTYMTKGDKPIYNP